MKNIIIATIISLVLISSTIQSTTTVIIDLTDDNIKQSIEDHDQLFVLFYSNNCEQSNKLKSVFIKAASSFKEYKVQFAKVDIDKFAKLGSEYKVKKTPALKFIKKGKIIDYVDKKDRLSIIRWINKTIQKPIHLLDSVQQISEIVEQQNKIVVLYNGAVDSDFEQILTPLSYGFYNMVFLRVDDQQIVKELDLQSKITVFKNFDEKRNQFLKHFDLDEVRKFLEDVQTPNLLQLDDIGYDILAVQKKLTLVFFLKHKDDALFHEIIQIAPHYRYECKFLVTYENDDTGRYQLALSNYGVKHQVPIILLIKDQEKFIFDKPFNKDNFAGFIYNYHKEKLYNERFYKSEPIPQSNEGLVKDLVQLTFEDLVIRNKQDVLIQFFSEKSSACKAFEPIYQKIAEKLQKSQNILISRLNSPENEIRYVVIKNYPTLILFKGDKKWQPAYYQGELSFDQVIQFLKDNEVAITNDQNDL